MEVDLSKALDKTKLGIMMNAGSVFLSTIAFSMKHVFTEDTATADVDGFTIRYNPAFFKSLSKDERIFLMAHEAWHVAFNHLGRENGRDSSIYNDAGDYVINQLLVDAKFKMPSIGLQDDRFRDMSTNQVYDIIYNETPKSNGMRGDIIIPKEGKEDKKIQAQVKAIIMQAVTTAQMSGEKAGELPAEISRRIEKLINPILSWENLLQRFLTEKIKDDYSWSKPNRRFMPDFYLPTQNSEGLANITIAIDTSGSISDKDLQSILSEIQYIRDVYKPKNLTIIDCDRQIHNVFEVTEDINILDLKFKGGGGSSCHPVFEYCNSHPTTALIYFTDLHLLPYTEQTTYDVLWIVYDNPTAKVHIGEIAHYDI